MGDSTYYVFAPGDDKAYAVEAATPEQAVAEFLRTHPEVAVYEGDLFSVYEEHLVPASPNMPGVTGWEPEVTP